MVQVRLRLGDEVLDVRETLPSQPLRLADIVPALQGLADVVVGAAARQAERQGRKVSCRAGCGACCRQPVPVAEAEAVYLAELVEAMPAEAGARVRCRFETALAALAQAGCLEAVRRLPRIADEDERRRIGIAYFRLQIPCPFLEDEACSIHPSRPLACREYLVTSPPAQCARPEAGVERVAFPVKPSHLLYRFGDGAGGDKARWLPLVLALEWAARGRRRAARRFPGTQLFEGFVRQLAGERKPALARSPLPD